MTILDTEYGVGYNLDTVTVGNLNSYSPMQFNTTSTTSLWSTGEEEVETLKGVVSSQAQEIARLKAELAEEKAKVSDSELESARTALQEMLK